MEATTSNERLAKGRFTPRSACRPAKIRFVGALDAYTVPAAIARIHAILTSGPREVIVDLAELERIDSVGVDALVDLHKRVTAQGGKVVVLHATEQPLMVLELCGLKATFGL